MKIGAILIGSKDEFGEEIVESQSNIILRNASPGTHVQVETLPKGVRPPMYPTEFEAALVAPHVARKALELERAGFDGIYVQASYDVGVDLARHLVKIPVVAPGRVSVTVASMLADKVGVVAPTAEGVPLANKLILTWGFSHRVVQPIRAVGIPILEIHRRVEENRERFINLSTNYVSEGAQVIVPLCGLNCPIYLSPKEVEQRVRAPVVDGSFFALRMLETLIEGKLSHSELAYPMISSASKIG